MFGNLCSRRELLDELRQRGYWREHALMTVLSLRWRAFDQRQISRPLRAFYIQ